MHQCQFNEQIFFKKSSKMTYKFYQVGLNFNSYKPRNNFVNLKSNLFHLLIIYCLITNVYTRDRPMYTNGQGPVYQTATACEGRQLIINCSQNEQINLIRANYGRFSISICNENGELDWNVQCMTKRSFRVIFDTCNGKQNCTMTAKAGFFGEDPCPNTEKYLEAHYQCVPIKQRRFKNKKTSLNQQIQNNNLSSNLQITTTSTLSLSSTTKINTSSLHNQNNQINSNINTLTTSKVDSSRTISNTNEESFSNPILLEQPSEENLQPNESNLLDTLGYNPIAQPLYCPTVISKQLRWNKTQAGKVVEQPCPEGATGIARWFCGVSNLANLAGYTNARQQAEWLPSGKPDFGECSSRVVQLIEKQLSLHSNNLFSLNSGTLSTQMFSSLEAILQLTKELQQFTSSVVNNQKNNNHFSQMYPDDFLRIAQLLNDFIEKIKSTIKLDNDQNHQKYLDFFAKFLIYVQNTVSDLIEIGSDSWLDLQTTEQRTVSSFLLHSLHKASHLLLYTMDKPQDFINKNSNIYISMHLRNTNVMQLHNDQNMRLSNDHFMTSIHSSSIDLNHQSNLLVNQENSIHIPWRTLVDFGQENLVRFALIIYKQLDQFIQPNQDLFHNNFVSNISKKLQINSDLVGLLLTNEPFLSIPGTVFVTFKHKHNLTNFNSGQLHAQNQICALWNYNLKQWQTEGCQLIESNRTHSTCECNNLSVFALLRATTLDDEQLLSNSNLTDSSTNDSKAQDYNNLISIGSYQWSFYSNQMKTLVIASCYLSIFCLSFVLISLALVQFKKTVFLKNLRKKKQSLNGNLTDLSTSIHYSSYHSSTDNSVAYDTSSGLPINKKLFSQPRSCTRLNLCFVLLLIELFLVFSSSNQLRFDYENRLNCAIYAALLHYLLLALFSWLLFDVLILHNTAKHHLSQFKLISATTHSISTISNFSPNLSTYNYQKEFSNKWLIAIAYGTCSLILLVSVLMGPQSYGNALTSGHCFLTNTGSSYFYFLITPLTIFIFCIVVSFLASTRLLAKIRNPLPLFNLHGKITNSEMNSTTNITASAQHLINYSSLCKQLKESVVIIIIVCLTWTTGLIYLNAAEKLPIPNPQQIGDRSYQFFGIVFSAFNIAQAAFFVLYYCILNSEVKKLFSQLFTQIKLSLILFFSKLKVNSKKKEKVASSISANTINTNFSTASSLVTNCTSQISKIPSTNNFQNSSINLKPNKQTDQSKIQQPIIPPPTTITNQASMKHFYYSSAAVSSSNEEPERCSIDYGFPPVNLVNSDKSNINKLNNSNNKNQFRSTTAFHSYQIAGSTNCLANLNCSANSFAYNSNNEQTTMQPSQIVEHVYECIDEDPYIAKLMSNYQTMNSHRHRLNHHHLHHLHKTLRPISTIVPQQQQQKLTNVYQQHVASLNNSCNQLHLRSLSDLSNRSDRPLLSSNVQNTTKSSMTSANVLPAIIRDNTKSTTILTNASAQHQNKQMNSHQFFNSINSGQFNLNNQQNSAQNLNCLNAQQLLKESTLI